MSTPIIVVNLKSDIQKKQAMIGEFQKFGIQHYEFLEAVDGNTLSDGEIAEIYDPEKAVEISKRPLSKAEIGCALSHLKIYQKMVDENIERMIILEDDVKLGCDFLKTEQYAAELPKRWEVLFLGYHGLHTMFRHAYKISEHTAAATFAIFCAHGYLIHQRGAQKLLNTARPLARPLDDYTGDIKILNVYILNCRSVSATVDVNSRLEKPRRMVEKMQKPSPAPLKILRKIGGEKFYHFAKKIYYATTTRYRQILDFKKHR